MFCDFSELCQFCFSTGVLPAHGVHTHWRRGKTEKGQSPEYFKIFEKNTIYNKHPVYIKEALDARNCEVKKAGG